MINVQLLKFPGRVMDFNLEEGSTIQDLFNLARSENASVSLDGEIRVRNSEASLNTRIYNGDRVIITKKVKGNQVEIKVSKFPGRSVDLSLDHGVTVQDAIDAARIEGTDGYQVRLNGVEVERSVVLSEGVTQRIILTKKVKGNK